MLLAYYNRNEEELNKIELGDNNGAYSISEFKNEDYRDFYRALILLETDSVTAYTIFDRLCKAYPQYPSIAVNRMDAKLKTARKVNKPVLYKEALEEWSNYEVKFELSNIFDEGLRIDINSNKLFALFMMHEYERLDELFGNIETPYQMVPEILESKINSLINRKKITECLLLLEDAENYHKFSEFEEIEFIKVLKSKLDGIDDLNELKIYYSRIFNSSPEKLIKILPEKINGKQDLVEFVVKEVAIAASKMLDKINALPDINKLVNTSKENRYTDLLQVALESRINSWGWLVKDQTRKAFSPEAKDLGEIDLDIKDYNQTTFVTCEAFILRNKSTVESHLKKLISNYTHQRKAFLIITYYIGQQLNFNSEWNYYYLNTLTNIKFPSGYELDEHGVIDVTIDFQWEHSGIKIGKATLINGSNLFNVFININYQLID